MSTQPDAAGDPLSQQIHGTIQRETKPRQGKPTKAPRPAPPRGGSSAEAERLRQQFDNLTRDLEQRLQGIGAEIKFLRDKLPEEDTAALEEAVSAARKSITGVKGQLGNQFRMINENRQTLREMAEEMQQLHAGMEDMRTHLDQLHYQARQQSHMNRTVFGDWQVGHLVTGGALAGGYAALGMVLNAMTGKPVVGVDFPQMLTAFVTGVVIFESTQQV